MGVKRITFSGGEPFLYPNIIELMQAAKQKGIKCYVVTNGSMLNENNVEEYLKYVDKISFSIDSPRSYINEKIGRGADSYEHIRTLLPTIRSIYGPDKLTIDINSVITYDETHEYRELEYMIESIRKDLLTYDIDKWKLIRFYPLRGKAKDNESLLWVPDNDFIEIKNTYSSNSPYLKIDVRDIKEMDSNMIVSPCGILKKSDHGIEYEIVDLKPCSREKGSGRYV